MNIYSFTHQLGQWLKKQSANPEIYAGKTKPARRKTRQCKQSRASKYIAQAKPPLMLVLAIASFTAVLGNRYYNQPKLTEGKTAPRTYVAPHYTSIVDTQETERLRREARNATVPILKKDTEITQTIITSIQNYLQQIETVREIVGNVPFVESTEIISLESQLYLRQASQEDWNSILDIVNGNDSEKDLDLNMGQNAFIQGLNWEKEQVIAKLQYYQQKLNPSDYQKLLEKIKLARFRYARAWQQFSQSEDLQLTDEEKRTILKLSDETWENTQAIIRRTTRRILTQGIAQGIPEDLIQETINIHLEIGNEILDSESQIPEEAKSLASSIMFKFFEPNLVIDEEKTKERAEKAAEEIINQFVYVKKDEIIVERGQEISHEQFLKLDEFGLSRRGIDKEGLAWSAAIATGAVVVLRLSQQKARLNFRCQDQILLSLLSLSAPILNLVSFPYSNLPAVGLLTSSFYGPTVAVTQVGVSTVLVIFANDLTQTRNWEPLATGAVGGIVAAVLASRMRDRDQLAQLGVGIGLSQWVVYVIIRLIFTSSPASILWTSIQQGMLYGLLPGLGWSVLALGISPYLERLFGLLTPSRLAELCNTNQPLLKRLAEEAPGTWQHTLFVASLAEGAARKLNCNVELIRAGTLYHDIGKLHDPQGFIENQGGGPNKHEAINDPWESVEIIKKHVSCGLVMARRHELPKAIADFIPQHQGTMLVAYFYFQAKKQAEENGETEICESDFRYDGPIPQSREAGIMMLADSCEAALRSLENVSRDKALVMIQKILKARWQDNQLVESGLNYEDLPIIAQVFVDVWEQSKHRRIAYPKAALDVPKK